MAGRSDIEAGGAFVRLFLKDDLTKALSKTIASAGKSIQGVGAGVMKAGGAVMAAGAAALGPLGAMVKGFADAGSAVADMAARTGMTAEGLTALGYAAGMTGASVEDVEKGVRKMQQTVADAAGGSETAAKALAALGLSAADLAGLSPEEQMQRLADGLASIEDPGQRTAAAMDVFGKSGSMLLPMMADGAAGLAKFRAEAEQLGLVMSAEDAAAADELGDSMDRVWGSLKGAALQIGAALAPAVTKLANVLTGLISTVVTWVRENRQLVVTVAAVAAGVMAAGAVLVGLGGAITALGFALSGIATAIGAIGAMIGVIVSPVGLVVAGLVAAGAAFLRFTTYGQQLTSWLGERFRSLLAEVKGVLSGISDAFAAGDLSLAANIAWAAVQLAFYAARDAILAGYEDLKAAGLVAWTTIKLAFQQAVNFIAAGWDTFSTGITSIFDGVVVNIRQAWGATVSWIAQQLLKVWGTVERVLSALGLLSEQTDVGGAIKIVQEDNRKHSERLDREKADRDQRRGADMAARDKARAASVSALDQERQDAWDAWAKGGGAGESPEAKAARERLEALKKQASAAAAAAEAGSAAKPDGGAPTGPDSAALAGKSVVTSAITTYSAAAAQAAGQMGGGGPQEKMLGHMDAMRKTLEELGAISAETRISNQEVERAMTRYMASLSYG